MPFTHADYLPSFEELETPEINLTAAPLRAAAHHLGKYCDHESKEFMLCSNEEKDPRKCIYQGKEVTRCALNFFQKIKGSCAEEYTKYWQCVDHAGYDMEYKQCRKSESVYDKCVFDKLGQEKPESGYFSRIRVHNTNRPKPKWNVPLPEATPDPPNPKDEPVPESAKYGSRLWFFK